MNLLWMLLRIQEKHSSELQIGLVWEIINFS